MALVKPQQDPVALIVKFFANEQGRDKFNKFIQYGARFLMYQCLQNDPKSEWAKTWKGLFILFRDARKLIRLMKVFAEIQKIQQFTAKPVLGTKEMVQIAGAAGLGTYWVFDNLVFLSKSGIWANRDEWAKLSMFGWWVGIVSAVIVDGMTLSDSFAREEKLKASLRQASGAEADNIKKELSSLTATRFNLYLQFPKNFGDLIPASNGWNLTEKIIGHNFNDGIVGLGGLVSSSVVMYNVFKTL